MCVVGVGEVRNEVLWEEWWLRNIGRSPSQLCWWVAGKSHLGISDIQRPRDAGIEVSLELTLEAVNTGRRKEARSSRPREALGKPPGNVRGYGVEEGERGKFLPKLWLRAPTLSSARGWICVATNGLISWFGRSWLYLLSCESCSMHSHCHSSPPPKGFFSMNLVCPPHRVLAEQTHNLHKCHWS